MPLRSRHWQAAVMNAAPTADGVHTGETPMTFDEEPVRVVKRTLDDMSIQDLKERIETLKGEIAACEQMIVKKEATRKAAEAAFFKS
jgi:uncharacterized small protein (DUF1192 family)